MRFRAWQQRLPVVGSFAGNHVVMLAAGEVFDVQVPDPAGQLLCHGIDVFAEHKAVADIEVGAEARMIEPVDPVAQFGDVFEKQARLALDADIDAERVGAIENRLDGFCELPARRIRRHPAEAPAAGDADVPCTDLLREIERFQDQSRRGRRDALD